jgi:hypothetical protein
MTCKNLPIDVYKNDSIPEGDAQSMLVIHTLDASIRYTEAATTVVFPCLPSRLGSSPLVIGADKVDLEPDFEEIDLSHERPQDLVRCENPQETLAVRRLAARMVRFRRKPVEPKSPSTK